MWGVCLTALDVILILLLQQRGFRKLEAFIIALLAIIAGCFAFVFLSQPEMGAVLRGFIPTTDIVMNPAMLYIAIGILGATVMPHNLYLHSAIVQTRAFDRTETGKREALRFATLAKVTRFVLPLGGSLLTFPLGVLLAVASAGRRVY